MGDQKEMSGTDDGTLRLDQFVSSLSPNFKEGLAPQEAQLRLGKYGRNILVPKKSRKLSGYFAFLMEPMVWLLAAASIVYWFLGDHLDSVITGVAVVPIGLIDVIIDVKTNNALKHLEALREPKVTVVRGGQYVQIPSEELVPGDHLIVKEGELVMADAAVVESSDLRMDESPLTGESLPVEKKSEPFFSSEFFGNQGSIFAGTRVLMGRASSIVVSTGQATHFGKIGGVLAKTESGRTKLQVDIHWVVTRLGAVAVGLSIFLVILEVSLGRTVSQAFISGVSLAIAAIPEELPVVFTLFLTLGMLELAHNKAVVRKLPAVEALGSVNVVCTDKTGTLTTGRMSIGDIYTDHYYSADEFLATGLSARFFLYAMMACEKDPFDYMEQAIYRLAAKTGAPRELTEWALDKEYAFDDNKRIMSHVWQNATHGYVLAAKGAVESILAQCNIDESRTREVLTINEKLGSKGTRLLGLAYKYLEHTRDRAHDEANMTFAGLLGFRDPLRPGTKQAVTEAQAAGVRVIMLTGDHKSTADAIAHEAGLRHDLVVEGSELEVLDEKQFLGMIRKNNIFCRILPEQKLRIVEGLQKLGYSVAVTGDGINDAPALKKADIGIAMGEKGTEVAKDAASMILLDDNFGTIVSSIRNGRKIYDNLQSAFGYVLAFHIPIFLSALIIPLLRLPLLLLPIDIVLLELVLHPIVSIVFQAQPATEDLMHRGPRERSQPIFQRTQLVRLSAIGLFMFLFSVFAYLWAYANGQSENSARGLALATMIVTQTIVVPAELGGWGHQLSRQPERNRFLLPSMLLVLGFLLALLYIPPLSEAVKAGPIGLYGWIIVALSGLAVLGIAEWTRPKEKTKDKALTATRQA